MTWPIDKLAIIQYAAELSGNNAPNTADDGSPEWSKASIAYEMALPYAIESKNWKFSTTVQQLTPNPVPPTDPAYDTAYDRPPDMWHLIWLRQGNSINVRYVIVNDQFWLNSRGAISGDGIVRAKYVYGPTPMDQSTPIFVTALAHLVMSGLYRGLNQNESEAAKMWAMGEKFIQDAATRVDQQEPRRNLFRSRMVAARMVRRPLWSQDRYWSND
jgi:hypothetical protein